MWWNEEEVPHSGKVLPTTGSHVLACVLIVMSGPLGGYRIALCVNPDGRHTNLNNPSPSYHAATAKATFPSPR